MTLTPSGRPDEPRPRDLEVAFAQRDDAAAVAGIHVAAWQAGYVDLFPPEYLASLSVADREESWASILEGSASRTMIARRNGEAVGFISFGPCRDASAPAHRGEVWALYVAPQAWSTGAGWALWEAGRVSLQHQGRTEVSLWVLSGNARGLGFYEAAGFRREPGSVQFFERSGTRLAEVRMVFGPLSAHPYAERARVALPRARDLTTGSAEASP